MVTLCFDGPDGARLRTAATAAHLRYIDTVIDEINLVGPLYDATGRVNVGSLYVLRTTSEPRA
jgi:uncharacterized protein YciI